MSDTDLNKMFALPDEIVWDEKQEEAIAACCDLSRRIVAVTGKAGTGKTMLLREVAHRLQKQGYIVQSSAPTGKAAKRIREATGLQAMTNHRMLGFGMPTDVEVEDERTGDKKIVQVSTGPKFGRNRPLHYDTILCDEYAMVNQGIHRNLIDALKAGARICMFGDVNQLKPIEEDRRLEQQPSSFMTALEKFGGITLDTIHRHDAGSGIARNGALILSGRMPRAGDDFVLRQTDQPVQRSDGTFGLSREKWTLSKTMLMTCLTPLPRWHDDVDDCGGDTLPVPDVTTTVASAATAVSTRPDRITPRFAPGCKSVRFITPPSKAALV